MIFALGFLAAGLVALMIFPAVNRRAERLAKRRLEATFPLSVGEMTAERDHLRAEFAVAARRFEQRIEAIAAQKTAARAEAGRSAYAIKTLEEDVAARKAAVAALDAETDVVRKNLAATRDTLARTETRLKETSDVLAEREQAFRALDRDHRAVLDDLDRRRILIADLETRSAGLDARLGDTGRTLAARLADLDETRKSLAEHQRMLAEERAEAVMLRERLATVEAIRGDQSRRIETLQASESAFAKKLTDATLAAARRDGVVADQDVKLMGVGRRVAELEGRLRIESEAAKGEVRAMAETLEVARAEKIAVDGALQQARADRLKLQREIAALKREAEKMSEKLLAEDAALRRRVEAVADDIVRLAAERETAPREKAPA